MHRVCVQTCLDIDILMTYKPLTRGTVDQDEASWEASLATTACRRASCRHDSAGCGNQCNHTELQPISRPVNLQCHAHQLCKLKLHNKG